MPANDALILLVMVPLLAACLAVVAKGRWRTVAAAGTLLALPLLLARLTQVVLADGVLEVALAGYAPPVGIRLRVDGLTLLLLWLVALVGGAAGLAAISSHPPASRAGGRFWPLWLLMLAGLNALFLSADLFSIYIALELVGLSAIALIAADGQPDALRAAMRYLLLAMLASLAYLLGVALLYGQHGTLDLYLLATGVGGSGSASTLPALSLIIVGLLLKSAVFPLHVWLPAAHSQAPGAVSAVLSGLVVKTAIYLLYRLWFWTAEGLDLRSAAFLLGLIGAFAILYGSLAALVQVQLKRVVAYSTVAQLGYLMLVFPLLGDPRAASSAWTGAGCQLFAHGLAKAGMFLAAAGLVQGVGSGRLDRLAGADRRQPACLFAFGLAGVSLMGLPPSAGFLAKWQLLESAWTQNAWGWVAVLLTGSLLAAGYVFRVLAAAFVAPSAGHAGPVSAEQEPPCPPGQRVSLFLSLPALALALASVLLGFWAAPLFEMLAVAPPALVDPLLPGESGR